MNSRFASLHAGLLIRERAPAPPPVVRPLAEILAKAEARAPEHAAVAAAIRPFPFPPAPAPAVAAAPAAVIPQPPQLEAMAESRVAATELTSGRKRSFTVRLDESQHLLLQVAKQRYGLSGQRILVKALESLLGKSG